MYKTGYVAIIGKTNVGKSTLVNEIVGQKVSIVSPKTQTTRENILGIYTKGQNQIIFVDTPGIHKTKTNLDRRMMKNVRSAVGSVDVIFYVIDTTKRLDDDEFNYIKQLSVDIPTIVGVSKTDLVEPKKLVPILTKLAEIQEIKTIIPFSSYSKNNLDAILEEILKLMPESIENNFIFNEDDVTDKSVSFMCAEIIREKALLLLNEELPHGVAIEITNFDESGKITEIDADFICERDSHKSIILGKNGSKIKDIGTRAREDMELLLQKKVMLKLWVKVVKNWRDSAKLG